MTRTYISKLEWKALKKDVHIFLQVVGQVHVYLYTPEPFIHEDKQIYVRTRICPQLTPLFWGPFLQFGICQNISICHNFYR